jgi:hypothetical protein
MDYTKGFTLGGPPRHVPLPVRLKVLFGGFLNQFGWVFFGFGFIFVWAFTLQADLTSWYVFRGELAATEGTIIESRETNMRVNETRVYEHKYSFIGADGLEYTGACYKTGGSLRNGQKVTIEYKQDNPETSRVKGMRRGVIGLFGLMPIIFPVIGLCFIIAGIRKGVKACHLLRHGEQTTGELISKDRTGTKVNDEPVYKLTFEFAASDGTVNQAVAKTHRPEVLEDEEHEPLLYDPSRPEYAVMLDDLPGNPRIDTAGNIRAGSAVGALLALFIPAVTLIGHGIYIYLRFVQ